MLKEHEANIHHCSSNGANAVYAAAKRGELAALEYLCQIGCEYDKFTTTGLTPLSIATFYGHTDIVKYLHLKGALLIHKNSLKSPLILAIKGKKYNLVEYLAKSVNKKEQYKDEYHPLLLAVKSMDQKCVSFFLKCGFDTSYINKAGESILVEAIKINAMKVIELICAHRPKLMVQEDGSYYTPLMFAIMTNRFHAANLLMRCGCNLYQRNSFGRNVEDIAKDGANKEGLKYLKQNNFYNEYGDSVVDFTKNASVSEEKEASPAHSNNTFSNRSNLFASNSNITVPKQEGSINGMRKRIKSIIETKNINVAYGGDSIDLMLNMSKKIDELSQIFNKGGKIKRRLNYRNSTLSSIIKDRNRSINLSYN